MVTEILAGEYVFDVVKALPPVGAANQEIVSPAPGMAESPTVPVPHPDPFTPVGGLVMFTVAVTVLLVVDTQPVVGFLVSA